jgi:hydroxylamine reductase
MFCYQCEQTLDGNGCIKSGICGKKSDVAALQDLLLYLVKGLSLVAVEGWKRGISDDGVNRFTA